MVKEIDIQRLILEWLDANHYFNLRVPISGVAHKIGNKTIYKKNPLKGFPDIMGILKTKPGIMFTIEVKSKNGKLRPDQVLMKQKLESAGVVYILARSLYDVIEELSKHEQYSIDD